MILRIPFLLRRYLKVEHQQHMTTSNVEVGQEQQYINGQKMIQRVHNFLLVIV